MSIKRIILTLLALTGLVVFYIALPDGKVLASPIQNLNEELKSAILASTTSKSGLNYYKLPDSNDLANIPQDPANPLTPEKVDLGKRLFHETALNTNTLLYKHWKQASCASCHFSEAGFKANVVESLGSGGLGWNKDRHRDPEVSISVIDRLPILSPSVLNSAYQHTTTWNGRAGVYGSNYKHSRIQRFDMNRHHMDGLEEQSIAGLTAHRMGTAAIKLIPEYQELFAEAFPDRPFVTAVPEDLKRSGMAIAAYQRTLLSNQAPFQKWLRGDKSALSESELRGGIVFFSSTCVQCHSSPSFGGDVFRAVGFADHPQEIRTLSIGRGAVTRNASDDFKFKVPQLYNLADSQPYGHGGSFESIEEVVRYFNKAEPQNLAAKYSGNLSLWFKELHLADEEVEDLVAFLTHSLRDPNLDRYVPESIPSGLCFPNNDPVSRESLGCD